MQCTKGHPQCLLEFPINEAQMHQAFKLASIYSVDTPTTKRFFQLPVADGADPDGLAHPLPVYPYVWHSLPETNTIRLEMGRDYHGKRIIAIFMLKSENRLGVIVHVAVFLMDESVTAQAGIDHGFAAIHSEDIRYHATAAKMFRGALLRMDLGNNAYVVTEPEFAPPPPPEDPPEPSSDFGEIDNL